MNSLMQQLFMIPEIRAAITTMPTGDNAMLSELQKMFCSLAHSIRMEYETKNFCSVYKDRSGQPMNPLTQMDVEEFMNTFFDQIEVALKDTPYTNFLKDALGGKLAQQVVSKVSLWFY